MDQNHNNRHLASRSVSHRSKSIKLADKMSTGNTDADRLARSRAGSIRQPLAERRQLGSKEPLEVTTEAKEYELQLPVPTFGDWKKQNFVYTIDTQPYATAQTKYRDSEPKYRVTDSQNSQKTMSKTRHPKFPRNNRLLSKFCSYELPSNKETSLMEGRILEAKVLPCISKTERVMAPPQTIQTEGSVSYRPVKEALLTRQSQQDELDMALLVSSQITQKKQFARIYTLQKQKYQSLLFSNGIYSNLPDDSQFMQFMKDIRAKKL